MALFFKVTSPTFLQLKDSLTFKYALSLIVDEEVPSRFTGLYDGLVTIPDQAAKLVGTHKVIILCKVIM